jgi:hypothetical protein
MSIRRVLFVQLKYRELMVTLGPSMVLDVGKFPRGTSLYRPVIVLLPPTTPLNPPLTYIHTVGVYIRVRTTHTTTLPAIARSIAVKHVYAILALRYYHNKFYLKLKLFVIKI